ncbi:MAG: ABC transporter permease [Lentisphaerae bacterium]|nr:ABC transporter permease [Lentisphaerota bacterium]
MLVNDLFRLSFHNLLLHKIRSFLTSLGIIFGVGSVISMLAISEGAKRQSLAQIEAMGIDKIIVFSKKPPLTGKNSSSSSQGGMTEKFGLTQTDLSNLKHFDNIERVTTIRNSWKKILKGVTRLDMLLVSADTSFLDDSKSKLFEGRWLNNIDENNASNVCVIGKNIKRNFFSIEKTGILGSMIRVENAIFKIVGIIENNIGTQLPEVNSPNDMIIIPVSTSNSIFGYNSYQGQSRQQMTITYIEYDIFIVKVADIAFIDDTAKRIKGYMDKTHQKEKDWGIIIPFELLKQREQTQNIFTVIMGSIAGISLLVGGVGIMNIMLANVYERRKEIGTRRALGAKKRDILSQFLIETVFLTVLGGTIGMTMGVAISEVVTRYAEWPTVYSFWSFALSIVISGLVGIIFGTYPAWKAAQQNPIEVLRSE